MSDLAIPPKPDPVMPVHVEQPAPLTTTPSTQASGMASMGVGTLAGIVLLWAYPKVSHGDAMPNDVAQALTGLAIMAAHGIQHTFLAYLEWKRPKP